MASVPVRPSKPPNFPVLSNPSSIPSSASSPSPFSNPVSPSGGGEPNRLNYRTSLLIPPPPPPPNPARIITPPRRSSVQFPSSMNPAPPIHSSIPIIPDLVSENDSPSALDDGSDRKNKNLYNPPVRRPASRYKPNGGQTSLYSSLISPTLSSPAPGSSTSPSAFPSVVPSTISASTSLASASSTPSLSSSLHSSNPPPTPSSQSLPDANEPVLRTRKAGTVRNSSTRLNTTSVKEDLNALLQDASADRLLRLSEFYSHTKKINRFLSMQDYDYYYPQLVLGLAECLDPLLDYLEMSIGFCLRAPSLCELGADQRQRLNDHFRKVSTFQLIKQDIPPSELDSDGFPVEDWAFVPELKKKQISSPNFPKALTKPNPLNVASSQGIPSSQPTTSIPSSLPDPSLPVASSLPEAPSHDPSWSFVRKPSPLGETPRSLSANTPLSAAVHHASADAVTPGVVNKVNATSTVSEDKNKNLPRPLRQSRSEEKLSRVGAKTDHGHSSPRGMSSQPASGHDHSHSHQGSPLEREELRLLLTRDKAETVLSFYDLAKIIRRELARAGKINFKRCFSGTDFVDYLMGSGLISERGTGIQLGIILQNKKLIFNSHFRPMEDSKDPIFSFSKWSLFFKFHKSVKLFGGRLSTIMGDVRHIDGTFHVPRLLISLSDTIFALRGHHAEGIFRRSESRQAQQVVKDQLEAGEYDNLQITDPHVAANVLTSWFLELEQSVIPQVYYNIISRAKQIADCEGIVMSLPAESRSVTAYLVRFLGRLAQPENVEFSKMTASNLAMVFSPCLFRLDSVEPEHVLEINAAATSLLTKLILAAIQQPDTYLLNPPTNSEPSSLI